MRNDLNRLSFWYAAAPRGSNTTLRTRHGFKIMNSLQTGTRFGTFTSYPRNNFIDSEKGNSTLVRY
jgi:hypothetical protein